MGYYDVDDNQYETERRLEELEDLVVSRSNLFNDYYHIDKRGKVYDVRNLSPSHSRNIYNYYVRHFGPNVKDSVLLTTLEENFDE